MVVKETNKKYYIFQANLDLQQRQLLQNLQHQFYLQQQHAKMQALQQQGTSSGQGGATAGPPQLSGNPSQSIFGARFPFQGSHQVDNRVTLPSPNQGRPSSTSPFHNNNHPNSSGTPLKGPLLPSGFDPNNRFGMNQGIRPEMSSVPSHSSLPGSQLTNIPHDMTPSPQELGARAGELTHTDSLSKSINSNSSALNDIKALLSRPDLATSITEDLLKQFSDTSPLDKALGNESDQISSQDRKDFASASGVHSASVSGESSDFKVSSLDRLLDTVKCDEEMSKYSSLPKLNVHMTGEQVIRACKGHG